MARDLIERLRRDTSTPYGCQNCDGDEREEAADEIARLRAENARLREVARKVAPVVDAFVEYSQSQSRIDAGYALKRLARTALNGEPRDPAG